MDGNRSDKKTTTKKKEDFIARILHWLSDRHGDVLYAIQRAIKQTGMVAWFHVLIPALCFGMGKKKNYNGKKSVNAPSDLSIKNIYNKMQIATFDVA